MSALDYFYIRTFTCLFIVYAEKRGVRPTITRKLSDKPLLIFVSKGYALNMRYWISLFLIGAALAGLFYFRQPNTLLTTKAAVSLEPIFLIPGSHATKDRFDVFVSKMIQQRHLTADHLKIHISHSGKLSLEGHLNHQSNHPFISVGFADNQEKDVYLDSKWLRKAIERVQQIYPFSSYEAVGHSNGGLILTELLESKCPKTFPRLTKFVAISTPFNGVLKKDNGSAIHFSTLPHRSLMLNHFLVHRSRLPKTLVMLSIAGNMAHSGSDGTVPVASAFSSRFIFQTQVRRYEEYLVSDKKSRHSAIVQNDRVVYKLKKFLLDTAVYP